MRRSFLARSSAFGVVALALVGVPSPSSTQPADTGVFPLRLVTGEGSGPALFLGEGESAAAIGYVSPGVEIELTGPPANGRAPVRVRGGMRVRGFLDAGRLSGRIVRRGRIRGTPVYVTGGDTVHVHGIGADQRADVSVRVVVAGGSHEYRGTYPVQGLGLDVPSGSPDVAAPGTACSLTSRTPIALADQPGGPAVFTLPAGTTPCRDLGVEGNAFKVLVGTGPFLAGYVAVQPAPVAEPTSTEVDRRFVLEGASASVPERLRHDPQLALVRIAAGTRVVHENETIAILDQAGFARVVERHDGVGEVDVFVAVDDRVAVRGLVEVGSIVGEVGSDAD